MNLSLFLFLIGILGFVLNRKNIILMIIAIEIMLLSVTLLILISSFSFDDGIGQTFSLFIISIAGAESVIGLSILVAFYRSLLISLIKTFWSILFIQRCINKIKIIIQHLSPSSLFTLLSKFILYLFSIINTTLKNLQSWTNLYSLQPNYNIEVLRSYYNRPQVLVHNKSYYRYYASWSPSPYGSG